MKRFLYFLFFVSVSSFSFSEDLGSCQLTQDPETGHYNIVCSGDTSSGSFTNCVELKQQLLSEVNTLSSSINSMGRSLGRDYMNASDAWGNYLPNMQYYNEWVTAVQGCQDVVDSYQRQLYNLADNVQTGDLYKAVSSIECADCPSSDDDSGSCTCNVNVDVDLSEIIALMNDAQNLRQHISDSVDSITNYLVSIVVSLHNLESLTNVVDYLYNDSALSTSTGTRGRYVELRMNSASLTANPTPVSVSYPAVSLNGSPSVIAILTHFSNNVAMELASLNNYAYRFVYRQMPKMLDVVTNAVPAFIDSATNFYAQTLFENTAVMGAYSSVASQGQSYHDFLTNYYIKTVNGRISELGSGGLYKQTNWFARVEALIAALVFTDEQGTNTVGVYDGQFDSVVQGATELPSVAVSRLSVFSDSSSSLVSSLRSLGNTFSSVADPGSVVLFNLPDSSGSGGGGDSIGFETSDLRNLIDVSRNVTTLAWVSVGLIFLFRFLYWTVRTSYSLVLFSWGVLSSIFSH